jgi:uncharacterized protein YndB with AHSA1/START domain
MPTVTVVTDIAASPPDVFGVIADFEQGPRWQPNMRSAQWTTAPPPRVGSTFEQTAHFMGRDLKATYEVTEYDPPRFVAIRSTSGPFPITVRRTVEPNGDGTRVTEASTGGPGGVARLFSPLLTGLLRRTIRGDYRHLTKLLEQRGG